MLTEKQIQMAGIVLNRAADLIEQRGHLKHDMGDLNRGFCISGAIRHANYEIWHQRIYDPSTFEYDMDEVRYRNTLLVQIGKSLQPDATDFQAIWWNNMKERTKEEVVAKLREVAATIHTKVA